MTKKSSKKKQPVLDSKQKKQLRGLAHHLSPVAMIGKEGITEKVIAAVNEVLDAHELIKIKGQENSPLDRREAAEEMAERTAAALIQVIGKNFILYRQNPDLDQDQKIKLF